MNDILDEAAKAGAGKAAEGVVDRVGNAMLDGAKEQIDKVPVLTGSAFQRYLKNATAHYNMVRTLATGRTPRPITGHDGIYVESRVIFEGEGKASYIQNAGQLFSRESHILIEGTGGSGKTMFMRYLFVNTAINRTWIPVLINLRHFNDKEADYFTRDFIFKALLQSFEEFDVELNKIQLLFALHRGKILILLDGFDEVKDSISEFIAISIQRFCKKYPRNPCVMTSRPNDTLFPFEYFSVAKMGEFNKEQAVRMVEKIGDDDHKSTIFCQQVSKELYYSKKYSSFVRNPLLLSMMYLVFVRYNDIPEHLHEFYEKAYNALYNDHDAITKGYFRRIFLSVNQEKLSEDDFKAVFSRFCFITYLVNQYEFSEDCILNELGKCLRKLNREEVNVEDCLADLKNIVCMIVREGKLYRFSHRSFQTYFAAYYTCSLSDEEQKKLFYKLLSNESYSNKLDYYELLFLMEPNRFLRNCFEDDFRSLLKEDRKGDNLPIYYLKEVTSRIEIVTNYDYNIVDNRCYRNNLFYLFDRFYAKISRKEASEIPVIAHSI